MQTVKDDLSFPYLCFGRWGCRPFSRLKKKVIKREIYHPVVGLKEYRAYCIRVVYTATQTREGPIT